MSTLLDGVLERHEGPEPRVVTLDVRTVLQEIIRPDDEDSGKSVALIAERAKTSTRTVYRVLQRKDPDHTISLDLADRLCLAAGTNVNACRIVRR